MGPRAYSNSAQWMEYNHRDTYTFDRIQPRAFPITHELNYIISLANDYEMGYYYVKSRPHVKIIEDLPNKVPDCKYKFWFVGGNWQSLVFDPLCALG